MGSLFPGRLELQCRHYTVIKFSNPRIRRLVPERYSNERKREGETEIEKERESAMNKEVGEEEEGGVGGARRIGESRNQGWTLAYCILTGPPQCFGGFLSQPYCPLYVPCFLPSYLLQGPVAKIKRIPQVSLPKIPPKLPASPRKLISYNRWNKWLWFYLFFFQSYQEIIEKI